MRRRGARQDSPKVVRREEVGGCLKIGSSVLGVYQVCIRLEVRVKACMVCLMIFMLSIKYTQLKILIKYI